MRKLFSWLCHRRCEDPQCHQNDWRDKGGNGRLARVGPEAFLIIKRTVIGISYALYMNKLGRS